MQSGSDMETRAGLFIIITDKHSVEHEQSAYFFSR